MITAGLLLVGATFALRIDRRVDLPLETALQVSSELSKAIEQQTGEHVVVESSDWSEHCTQADRCVTETLARTGATELLSLRLLAGPSKIRVELERSFTGLRDSVNLEAARETWSKPLKELALRMWPPGAAASSSRIALVVDPTAAPRRLWPKVSLVGGLGLGAVAVVLAVLSANARSRLEAQDVTGLELRDLSRRANTESVAAEVLGLSACLITATGLFGLALE